jgi:hypothetical protein
VDEEIEENEKQQLEEANLEDENLIVKAPDVISNEEDLEKEDDDEVVGRAKRAKMK